MTEENTENGTTINSEEKELVINEGEVVRSKKHHSKKISLRHSQRDALVKDDNPSDKKREIKPSKVEEPVNVCKSDIVEECSTIPVESIVFDTKKQVHKKESEIKKNDPTKDLLFLPLKNNIKKVKHKSKNCPSKDVIFLPDGNRQKAQRQSKKKKPSKDELFFGTSVITDDDDDDDIIAKSSRSKRDHIGKYIDISKRETVTVNDSKFPTACSTKNKKNSKRKCGCMMRVLISSMCLIILLLASAFPVTLFIYPGILKTGANILQISHSPTISPTNNNVKFLRPTVSPTVFEFSDIAAYIKFLGFTNNTKLLTPGTPQNEALKWFVNDPLQKDREKLDKRYLQRYVLGIFYFSLSEESIYGNGWHMCSEGQKCSSDNKTSWLSEVDECFWAMIKCDRSGYVTEISSRKSFSGLRLKI